MWRDSEFFENDLGSASSVGRQMKRAPRTYDWTAKDHAKQIRSENRVQFQSLNYHVPIIFPSFSHHFPIIFPTVSDHFRWILP
jgi:hypothetical protein